MILNWNAEFSQAHIVWICLAATVMLVTLIPGIILFYQGIFRQTRVQNQLPQWLLYCGIGSLAWSTLVYTLSFAPSVGKTPAVTAAAAPTDMQSMLRQAAETPDEGHLIGRGGWIGGTEFAAFNTLTPEGNSAEPLFSSRRPHHHVPHVAFQYFHLSVFLAAFTSMAALLSLSVGWTSLTIVCLCWGVLVYAPMAHWVWGDGWLSMRGAVDFGGGLLHLTIGFSALALMICRLPVAAAESKNDGDQDIHTGINDYVASAGLALFAVGLAFLYATLSLQAPVIMVGSLFNSQLAAATGAVVWCLLSWLRGRQMVLSDVMLGALAGLATVAGGSGVIVPSSAVVGSLAGSTMGYAALIVCSRYSNHRYAAMIFSAQGIPAAAGLIMAGVFSYQNFAIKLWDNTEISGLIDGNPAQLMRQLELVGAVALLASVGTILVVLPLRLLNARQRIVVAGQP